MAETNKDEFLLERAKSGDQDAFLLLYDRHRIPIFRFLYRLLGSAEIAEDITHDCFVNLIRGSEKSQSSAPDLLRTRLYSTARNLAMEYSRNSHKESFLEDIVKDDATSRRSKPNDEANERGMVSSVGAAVAGLPPLERETLILAEYEGLELDEIAEIVGADGETVASRLGSARERLRDVLAGYL